jgi:hypothetical protein
VKTKSCIGFLFGGSIGKCADCQPLKRQARSFYFR